MSRSSSVAVVIKSIVLSKTAEVFDPLGIVAPVTVLFKYFLQTLWKLRFDWDDPVPENYSRQWTYAYTNVGGYPAPESRVMSGHVK